MELRRWSFRGAHEDRRTGRRNFPTGRELRQVKADRAGASVRGRVDIRGHFARQRGRHLREPRRWTLHARSRRLPRARKRHRKPGGQGRAHRHGPSKHGLSRLRRVRQHFARPAGRAVLAFARTFVHDRLRPRRSNEPTLPTQPVLDNAGAHGLRQEGHRRCFSGRSPLPVHHRGVVVDRPRPAPRRACSIRVVQTAGEGRNSPPPPRRPYHAVAPAPHAQRYSN